MYEDFLRTILRIEIAIAPEQPAGDEGFSKATYSGPADVDGDQGASTLRRVSAPRAKQAASKAVESAGKTPAPSAGKPRTYRKADDPDPYVGVGRNDPCPCGSGKKFKNCHGRNR